MAGPDIDAQSPSVQESLYAREAGAFLSIMDEMASHIRLDYSVDSLQRLEEFICEHFEPPGVKPVAETLPNGIGCYLGEVIIRNLGGHWNEDGKPEVNDIGPLPAILPIEKAIRRFKIGRAESLAWYYHSLAKQAYEAGMPEPTPATANTGSDEDGGLLTKLKGFFKR